MRIFILISLALSSVSCMKSGPIDRASGSPMGNWVLASQESRDSTGRSEGFMDLSSRPCPHYLVITGDSIKTISTVSATGTAAKSHSNCYFHTSEAYIHTEENTYASASNPHVSISLHKDSLVVEQSAIVFGKGPRKLMFSYRRWEGEVNTEQSPCSCGPAAPSVDAGTGLN